MSYRPICDVWLLARSKTKYYGAYPAGFLQRARDLIGCSEEDSEGQLHEFKGECGGEPVWVKHECGGKVIV